MGLTPAEFLRGLPGLAGEGRWRRQGGRVRLQLLQGEVVIELQPMPARRIAALEIPVTRVVLDLSGLPPAARGGFLERFDLHYRRGGG